jgi:hypothetical protein
VRERLPGKLEKSNDRGNRMLCFFGAEYTSAGRGAQGEKKKSAGKGLFFRGENDALPAAAA